MLRFPDPQPENMGVYWVVVSNEAGSVTSAPAMLSVIPPVQRRLVPGLALVGAVGTALNLDYSEVLPHRQPTTWLPLDTVTLASSPQFYFDAMGLTPPQRFYRAWQPPPVTVAPAVELLRIVPELTLTGAIGDKVRVDAINQFGPIDAWFTLDTVTLTNTTQLYFDTASLGQPPRLYRLVPVP
jgi:hypothetical protein